MWVFETLQCDGRQQSGTARRRKNRLSETLGRSREMQHLEQKGEGIGQHAPTLRPTLAEVKTRLDARIYVAQITRSDAHRSF